MEYGLMTPFLCMCDSEILDSLSHFCQRAGQTGEEKVRSLAGPEFIGQFNSFVQRQPDFNISITQTILLNHCTSILMVVDAFIPLAPSGRNFTTAL